MRFCMVSTFYPPHHFGGDAIFVERLTHALARRGHSVTVVHDLDAFRMLSPRATPARAPEPEGVELVALESGLGTLSHALAHQLGRPVIHRRRLAELLDSGRFDVIHYHNVSLVGGPGVLALGSGRKLYTAHEHWLICPTHTLWRHDREPCAGPECLRCLVAHRRPPQLWRFTNRLRRSLGAVDLFLSPSEFTRRIHRARGFPRHMEVLPPFVPDAEPSREPRPHERPYLLFVGRLEKAKGLQSLIPRLDAFPGVDLLVVGDGNHAAALRELASNRPHIRFLGQLPSHAIDPLYRHAIALVMPGLGYETFGMVALEAFRQGTPILARNVGPLPEILEQSDGGLGFDDDDGLARALSRLVAEPRLRERLGEAGRRALGERWSESAHLGRYFDLIATIAKDV